MTSPPPRIVLAEDEADIASVIVDYLRHAGYRVDHFADGTEALEALRADPPDLAILDLMLPGTHGLAILEACSAERLCPVICVTAKVEEVDRLIGLEMGADDYVTKPISPKVLVSRVNALFRRINKEPEEKVLKIENLTIDPAKFEVTVDGKDVTLAKKEFELLYLLASRPGRVFLRNEILNQVWGNEVIVGDRTIDVHIRKIRQKLGLDCITTVKGVGYKFNL